MLCRRKKGIREAAARHDGRVTLLSGASIYRLINRWRGTNYRESAWLGLVPRQYSSGGKSRLQGISKRGDTYLRTLLIHGARVDLRYAIGKADARSRWLQDLIEFSNVN